MSLPGSPLQRSRRVSRSSNTGSHSYSLRSARRHWLRSSHHLDTRDHLPWVDDSRVGSPTSLYLVSSGAHSRHNSYSSHTSRLTYNSHGELTRPGPHPALLASRWSHWVEGFHTNNDTVPYSLSPPCHTNGHSHSAPWPPATPGSAVNDLSGKLYNHGEGSY